VLKTLYDRCKAFLLTDFALGGHFRDTFVQMCNQTHSTSKLGIFASAGFGLLLFLSIPHFKLTLANLAVFNEMLGCVAPVNSETGSRP